MTRTAPAFQPRQSNHGHKRKGKPVEAWMLELEKAQDEENGSQTLDLTAIEEIADGVEQMIFSWGQNKQERGQEYAKLSKSLAKENSHVLLPWSLNETEVDSASEIGSTARDDTLQTTGHSASTQPQVARAHTPVIKNKCTSPKLTPPKQRGDRCPDNFGSGRDRSVTSELALENPQTVLGGDPSQPKYESSKCLRDSCHGVMASTNTMRKCTTQNRGEIQHNFDNRAREESTCQAMAPDQERICGSIESEFDKDNCMSSNLCIPSAKSSENKGHNPRNSKEVELRSCLGDKSSVWTPEAATSSPERRKQQPMISQTSNQHPLFILNHDRAGTVSPLLSQSPLCAQSPLTRSDTAQSSEVMFNEHQRILTSLTGLPMGSPMYENGPEGLTPLVPFLDAIPSCGEDTESVEVGGHTIKVTALRGGNDVLEDKFQALVNINAGGLGVQEDHQLKPSPTSDVEELQIALLECAMEYEIKTIEAKMKMQELKLKGQQNVVVAKSEQPCPQKVIELVPTCERTVDHQRLQQLKKQTSKLQHEKDRLSNELHCLREKERQFERQKRSLEDAILRVNRLQREVVKKEQEVVEWQLKEKETKAQLQEVGEKLKRERHAQLSLPLEPKKLLTLLPALREWLRSLKKVGLAKSAERRQFQDKEEGENIYPYMLDGHNLQPSVLHSRDKGIPVVPAHMSLLGQLSEELANQSNPTLSVNQVDVVICCLTKEIHALQKELNKLARS